jgi:putative membrane protein insertion efficiency factor
MKYVGIGFVYAYRWLIAPLLPPGSCKYHPSCSQYAIDAFEKYGFVRGSAKAARRLLRCHPWSHGGVDYA